MGGTDAASIFHGGKIMEERIDLAALEEDVLRMLQKRGSGAQCSMELLAEVIAEIITAEEERLLWN